MKEVVAEIVHHARRSPDVNQRSGVSVRASISLYEALVANAFRRALRTGESEVVPRISDLPFTVPAFQGKVELESMEEGQEERIMERLYTAAVKVVFDRHYDVNDLEAVAGAFMGELTVETGESTAAEDYAAILEKVPGLRDVFPDRERVTPGQRAATVELILEGLHLHKLLNKYDHSGYATYTG
jgi:magnesium chelatase subunit I